MVGPEEWKLNFDFGLRKVKPDPNAEQFHTSAPLKHHSRSSDPRVPSSLSSSLSHPPSNMPPASSDPMPPPAEGTEQGSASHDGGGMSATRAGQAAREKEGSSGTRTHGNREGQGRLSGQAPHWLGVAQLEL